MPVHCRPATHDVPRELHACICSSPICFDRQQQCQDFSLRSLEHLPNPVMPKDGASSCAIGHNARSQIEGLLCFPYVNDDNKHEHDSGRPMATR